jgi:hypothetical protein
MLVAIEDGVAALNCLRELTRLRLDLELSAFKNVSSSGHHGLSKMIRPFGEARENPAVSILLCEISTNFDMSICLSPSFERLPTGRDLGDPQCLVVGASHAARLVEQLRGLVLVDDVCVSGWRAGKASSEALATKISNKLAGGTAFDLIVLQLFDNTSFYARTCEGGLIPCRRELNSSTIT